MNPPRKTKARIIGTYDGRTFAIVMDPKTQTIVIRERCSRKPVTFPVAELLRRVVQQRDGSLELQTAATNV